MTDEKAREDFMNDVYNTLDFLPTNNEANRIIDSFDRVTSGLEQHPCEMTVEEYRQRMIDAFHNADCDELIAVVVRPEESEFKQLEWLLKNHYHKQKQQPCEDCISRQAVLDGVDRYIYKSQSTGTQDDFYSFAELVVKELPSVTPKEKTGHWIDTDEWRETVDGFEQWGYFRKCSKCGYVFKFLEIDNFCPNCGARMVSE